MADDLRMALAEVLRKAGVEEADFLREGVRVLAGILGPGLRFTSDAELASYAGAAPWKHPRPVPVVIDSIVVATADSTPSAWNCSHTSSSRSRRTRLPGSAPQ